LIGRDRTVSKLVLFMPDGTTLDVPLARERTTIGRRADNDICLPDLAVSGEHAVVVTILADSFLEDLGSTNGTLVNGRAIAKHFLRDRDQVEIGRHKLVYCADDATVIEGEVIRTVITRGASRDLGEVVDSARPFVRARREPLPSVQVPDGAPPLPPIPADPPRARAVAVDNPGAALGPPVAPPALAPQPLQPLQPLASIKVLTGINAGVSVPLTKAETTIGRPGLQVAAIVRTGELFVLKPIEGARPPTINDQPVAGERTLVPGDVIAIAGTRIEFVAPAPVPAEPARRG
jgi:pSer/pThr/pTyr-binding forkhead associated (FHA) protein